VLIELFKTVEQVLSNSTPLTNILCILEPSCCFGLLSESCYTTRHEGAWVGRRYSGYSFSTSALDGGEWSASLSNRSLAPGKGSPLSIVQEAGWALVCYHC
jgi:hypothetical protein